MKDGLAETKEELKEMYKDYSPKTETKEEPLSSHCNCLYFFDSRSCGIAKGRTKTEATKLYDKSSICPNYILNTLLIEEPETKSALEMLNVFEYVCPTDSEEILIYKDGIYEPAKPVIHKLLEETYKDLLKRHFVDEIYAHLQRSNYIDRSEINNVTDRIPLQNGLFNLKTYENSEFDSLEHFTYKLNVSYDKTAKCPKWEKFVSEILETDDIPLLQEIMGYCLLPNYPLHKIFWFHGDGRNGKGVVIRTLQHILGKESYSCLDIDNFYGRFAVKDLYGKLLNVSSEPKLSKRGLDTTIAKKLTGQDEISAELKNKNKTLRFTNYAKILVVGNRFPKVTDNTTGWRERRIVLKFPNTFTGENLIPDIEQTWIPEELSGIFNWMLEGLKRLNEKAQFTTSKSTEEMELEFEKASNPFNAWLIENCVFISNAYILRDDANENYENYCNELEVTKDSKKVFYEKMRTTPKIKDTRKFIAGKAERVFEGISLKNMTDMTDMTGAQYRECLEDSNIEQVSTPVKGVISVMEEPFFIKCFDCQKTLNKNEVCTFQQKPYCIECRQKFVELF